MALDLLSFKKKIAQIRMNTSSLCCLSCFDLQILITPMLSLNSSYKVYIQPNCISKNE